METFEKTGEKATSVYRPSWETNEKFRSWIRESTQ